MAGNSRSGRRRQPDAVRALKGSKTRSYHRHEPAYEPVMPVMPLFVSADPRAVEKWTVLGKRLSATRVLTEADGEMLALLCTSWADLERLRDQYAAMNYQSLVVDEVVAANGERRRKVKANPLIALIRETSLRVSRFLGEFGLTPMTRAKVGASPSGESDDPFAKFLTDEPVYTDHADSH